MGISRPVSNASMRRPKPNPALPPAYSDGRDVDAVLNKMVMAAQAYDAGPGDMRSKQQLLPSMSQPELVPISAISPYDESARLRREVVRVRRLCEAKLAAAEEEYRVRIERLHIELTGSMEEQEALRAEKAKEERIEFLHNSSLRRMLNKGLSRSWSAWLELCDAQHAQREKLARIERAARQFKSPELSAAFKWWALVGSSRKKAWEREQLVLRCAALEEVVAKAEAEAAKALQRQLVELAGGSEEREALRAEQEREERVELMRRQVTRRMLNKDLADGWSAWYALWEARSYSLRRLREVGNKLQAPALLESWEYWAGDALETKRAAALAALEAESKSLAGQLQRARFEAGQLSLVKTQLEDERDHLKERLQELSAKLTETMDALHVSSAAASQAEALQKALDAAESEAEALEAEKEALQNASVLHRKESEKLLERLLAEQRKSSDEELQQWKDQAWARTEKEAKEARIALLHRQALNRAKHKDILRGWTQWLYWYEFRAELLAKMTEGAKKTTRVSLSLGFHGWLRGAFAMREAKVRAEAMQGYPAMEASLVSLRAELAASQAEKMALLGRLAALQGNDPSATVADIEKLHAAKLAAEKEERIELLRRQSGRRMLNQGVSNAWSAWLELWHAKTYAMERLREAGKRLRAPTLAHTFDDWSGMVAEAREFGLLQSAREREAAAANSIEGVREEMEGMRLSYEKRLLAAEEAKLVALERLRVELVGSLEERMAMGAEKAKEEAIEHRHRQSVRRLMNSGLTRGFSAWTELWEARTSAHNQLRQAAVKLHAPDLAFAFEGWAVDMAAAKQAAHAAALEAESKSFEVQLRRARFENSQLEVVKAAHLDELRSLRDRVEMLMVSNREQHARIEADDELKSELKEMRKQHKAAVEAAEVAEAAKVEADEDLLRHKTEMQELMERLLANQRRTFEEDMARMGQVVDTAKEKRAGADEANEAARDKIEGLQAELVTKEKARAQAAAEAQAALEAATSKAAQDGARLEGRINELLALTERGQQELAETSASAEKAKQASEAKAAEELALAKSTLGAELQQASEAAQAVEAELAQLRESSAESVLALEAELAATKQAKEGAEGEREAERAAKEAANKEREEEGSALREAVERLEKEVKELQKQLKAAQKAKPPEEPPKKKGTSVLGKIDIDEGPDAPPITEQIASALRSSAGRVLDLFREWDTNGDGEVSRKEFHEAMSWLGLEVPKAEIDKLFNQWDAGGEGSLDYKELSKILKAKPAGLATVAKAAAAFGKVKSSE